MKPVQGFRSVLLGFAFLLFVTVTDAATFTVVSAQNSGAGTLRQAIVDANATPGPDVIAFNLAPGGLRTIALTNELPVITDTVTLDAWTQPGFAGRPVIELAGEGADGLVHYGFRLQSHNNIVRGFIINRMVWYGIYLEQGSSGNKIEGNWIGTDATGKLNLGMNGNGITINVGTNNLIGGTNAQSRNVIAGNTMYGVALRGSANTVVGNYIGTDVDGTNAIPNGFSFNGTGNFAAGIWVEGGGAIGNQIGGTWPGAGNLISGNIRGIVLYNGSRSNVVQGNIIGINASGTGFLNGGNKQLTGIYINNSHDNLVGGVNPLARNVISGNGNETQGMEGNGLEVNAGSNNSIQGNYIGTDFTGTMPLKNLRSGIAFYSAHSNIIGGTLSGAGNLISGNGNSGVLLWTSNGNSLQGNFVGTRADGESALGNAGNGVHIFDSSGNTIGGTTSPTANKIAHQSGHGVFIAAISGSSTGNLIRRNSFFSNTGLGIELFNQGCFGCTPFNDPGDGDSGPNQFQNFPVLTAVSASGGSISISGTLNSTPNSPFIIEFFVSPELDQTGFGEGKTYLGSVAVVTDGSGNASFTAYFVDAGYGGQFISVTATDGARNTSEFSAAMIADVPAGVIQFNAPTYQVTEAGAAATIAVVRLAGSEGPVSVRYSTSNSTAIAGEDYTATTGILHFASGQTQATFTVPIINDTLNETDETVTLTLDNPAGGVLVGSSSNALLVISDNDPIYIYAGDAAVTKSPTGNETVRFPITLSAPSSRSISVSYSTTNITAESGVDYVGTSGVIEFAPGITNLQVSVTALAGPAEGTKSFLLSLSNPVNAIFGDPQALGTIYDGTQGILQFNASAFSVGEEGEKATITVLRVGGTLGAVSVAYGARAGTALNGSDFTEVNGVLVFANGQATRSFQVPVLDDSEFEGNKTVLLQLENPAGTTLGVTSSALLTIQDNDAPPLAIESLADAVVLRWPTQAVDFRLERETVLPPEKWTEVTGSPVITGNQFAITNPVSGTVEFFRLRR